ncbi:MAG: bifunctional metallophosphatase/5'-nucleotidase [Kineosporiaceae bacterium]
MAQRRRRRAVATAGVLAAGALLASSVGTPAQARPRPVDLQILSFNDYHGHLEPPAGADGRLPGRPSTEGYGGVEYLSSTLSALRTGHRNTLTVAAGDLIGASPVVSGLFHDEPSVESLNTLGLDVSSVGNHEFDEGATELLRMQYGGCHPVEGCFDEDGFSGARFPWLAANVTYKPGVRAPRPVKSYGWWFERRTGRTVLPPTWVTKVEGIKVGFIGMTLEGTPELVAQAGIKDLDFRDEVVSAGLAARDLRKQGVNAIVVLVHEGGLPPSGAAFDFPCNSAGGAAAISGPIVQIAKDLDPSIDLVVSGHTHQPYTCVIPDPAGNARAVTSAMSFGRLVTETSLQLDRRTKDVVRSSVTSANRPVARTTADPAQTAVVSKWKALAAPLANRRVGSWSSPTGTDITRSLTRDTESALGDLIADAQLDRTRVNGAQIALMNPGGVRADLIWASSPAGEGDGVVTYGEAFAVQPFANTLVTMTLTGAQLKTVLEQQWAVRSGTETFLHLGISNGLTYSYAPTAPLGSRIVAGTLKLGGVLVDPATAYRVTVNSFLADGGDSFVELRNGTNRVGGGVDLDELINYLGANEGLVPPVPNRATKLATP